MIGRIQDSERGDDDTSIAPQPDYIMVPQVEVIAPTPVISTTELANLFEADVLKVLEGEEESEGESEEGNRKSEDSIGQKNSSNSTEEGSYGSNDSSATVQRQADAAATALSDAKEAASTAPLTLATSIPAILSTEVPITNSPIDAPAQSQWPASLQRPAH
jgi:hypothetical protein